MIFIMARSFKEAIQHRRTHYGIGNNSPISDNEIHEIIKTAVTHVPSAFNSQSTRIVLLLGESHKKLWEIVKDTLWHGPLFRGYSGSRRLTEAISFL